jgi:archaellum component FlaF (FlaF/FlaG flagellin family)
MGFSIVAATAIIGVSILICIELMVGTTIPTLTDVHDAYDKMRDRSIEQVQTDITINDAATSANDSNYDLNITVENTGSISLEAVNFNILINGTDQTFSCSESFLHPEKEIYFYVDNLPGTGSRRLKVITNNGISDYHDYTIS